ncbi:hypothetical protein HK102_011601, partial [Quaeritorhiza haematococci]
MREPIVITYDDGVEGGRGGNEVVVEEEGGSFPINVGDGLDGWATLPEQGDEEKRRTLKTQPSNDEFSPLLEDGDSRVDVEARCGGAVGEGGEEARGTGNWFAPVVAGVKDTLGDLKTALHLGANVALFYVVVSAFWYASSPEFRVFSLHIYGMGIFFLCSVNAIFLLQQAQCQTRKRLARFHWQIQLLSLLSALVGFLAVFLNRYWKNKTHFKSWHGIIGLATL